MDSVEITHSLPSGVIPNNDFPDWNDYNLGERDAEMVALFGEHMKLAPVVAARLSAKLASILCKIKYCDPLEEYCE